jgi:hypothetical protein
MSVLKMEKFDEPLSFDEILAVRNKLIVQPLLERAKEQGLFFGRRMMRPLT